MNKAGIWCLLTIMCFPCSAAPLDEGAFDMISISADEASEDEQPGVLYFNGHFSMKSNDWQLTAEEATVYGRPDMPDRVYLAGSPARFLVNQNVHTGLGQIKAAALAVEYLREANLLLLSGGATLMLGDEVISSAQIEYDISTNRYQASGDDGVVIKVPPID